MATSSHHHAVPTLLIRIGVLEKQMAVDRWAAFVISTVFIILFLFGNSGAHQRIDSAFKGGPSVILKIRGSRSSMNSRPIVLRLLSLVSAALISARSDFLL